MDLEEKFVKSDGKRFDTSVFYMITDCLQYPETDNGQNKFYNVLNKLSLADLIVRVTQVSILVKTLKSIQRNKRR
jgi:hypothetical protein